MIAPVTQGLETRGLTKSYGGLTVASDINIRLEPGCRTALIGPNGAGKTTFSDLVTGITPPTAGDVFLDGQNITRLPEARRVRAGLAKTFQITSLFKDLTVRENLRLPVLERHRATWRPFRRAGADAGIEAEIDDLLTRFRLTEVADQKTVNLAYGQQRMVEIALTLALKPRVLILDEPAAGVPGSESGLILDAIRALPKDLAVLIIEHDMDLVFKVAASIIVLVQGAILTEGTPHEIATNEQVRELYLGKGHG